MDTSHRWTNHMILLLKLRYRCIVTPGASTNDSLTDLVDLHTRPRATPTTFAPREKRNDYEDYTYGLPGARWAAARGVDRRTGRYPGDRRREGRRLPNRGLRRCGRRLHDGAARQLLRPRARPARLLPNLRQGLRARHRLGGQSSGRQPEQHRGPPQRGQRHLTGHLPLGTTPQHASQQHIHDRLIEEAKKRLSFGESSISEVAYQLGLAYSQSFSSAFKATTGQTPLEFRSVFN